MGTIHKELDRAFLAGDHRKFDELIGELTPRELSCYMGTSTEEKDVLLYLWSYHVSWGFESCWADWVLMTEEERAEMQAESPDYNHSPPENFEIDKPLKTMGRWHIADAAADRN
jgi:hypothetical protein